jgi:hypothetical protein
MFDNTELKRIDLKLIEKYMPSLSELETQLFIAERLGYLKPVDLAEEVEALRRKTLNFIKYMKSGKSKGANE